MANIISCAAKDKFKKLMANIIKIGINALPNHLFVLRDKIPFNWLNLSLDERLFLGVLIEVYFLFLRIIFLIFNFSIFEKPSRYFKINLQSLACML